MIILANLMSFECFRVCSIDFRAQNWICKHSEAYFCQNSTDYAISVTKCAIFSFFWWLSAFGSKNAPQRPAKWFRKLEIKIKKKHIKTIPKWKILFLINTNRKINDFLQKWFFIIFCKKSILEFLDFWNYLMKSCILAHILTKSTQNKCSHAMIGVSDDHKIVLSTSG